MSSTPLPAPPAALASQVKGLLARADQWEAALSTRPELGRLVYYSRFAAASAAIRALDGGGLPAGTPARAEAEAWAGLLLSRIDADKRALGIMSGTEAEAADLAWVQRYALDVFRRADDADRAAHGPGAIVADKAVGQAFATAACLLDVVRSLSTDASGVTAVPASLTQVAKYAKGRAGGILIAARDGVAPPPPAGYAAEADALAALGFAVDPLPVPAASPSSYSAAAYAAPAPATPASPVAAAFSTNFSAPLPAPQAVTATAAVSAATAAAAAAAAAASAAAAAAAPSAPISGGAIIPDATEYTKHALSALKLRDVQLAASFLRKALAALGE